MENINDVSKWVLLSEDDKYVIYLHTEPCDQYMHINSLALTAINKVVLANNDPRQAVIILYDSNLNKFNISTQNFLINHELGHIMNEDMDNMTIAKIKKLTFMRSCGVIPIMEFKADLFSAAIIGKGSARKSLMQLAKCKELPFISRKECFFRWVILSILPVKKY